MHHETETGMCGCLFNSLMYWAFVIAFYHCCVCFDFETKEWRTLFGMRACVVCAALNRDKRTEWERAVSPWMLLLSLDESFHAFVFVAIVLRTFFHFPPRVTKVSITLTLGVYSFSCYLLMQHYFCVCVAIVLNRHYLFYRIHKRPAAQSC